MQYQTYAKLSALVFAITASGSALIPRAGVTCDTCPLGGNPFVQLVEAFIEGSGQTTDDCRLENLFGLPASLGASGSGLYDAGIRVNFEDDRIACSVETFSRPPGDDAKSRCVQGGCEILNVTDDTANVKWGGCLLKPLVAVADGQALGDAECIPVSGEILFSKNNGCGKSKVLSTNIGGLQGDALQALAPRENDGNGIFTGGVVTQCSTV